MGYVSECVGVVIYGSWCLFMGWGVCIWDGVLVNGMGC